ncbi:MAG TPA: ABC transporter permease [Bryobacteraceae bacterium]|nr:ABC transporter permease [Bryobacteraceae bacterium]
MRLIQQLRLGLRSLLRRHAVEQELDEEIRYHIERQIEEDIARGMPREEAIQSARRSLLGVEARKDECRDTRKTQFIENLVRDLGFALRQMERSPAFAITAVSTLALGVCAATVIFSYVDAALIKPLPYPNPSRLVFVTEAAAMFPRANLSYLDYLDWKRMNQVFESLDLYHGAGFLVNTPDGVQLARGARVSAGFLQTLGIKPMLGRDFAIGEDLPGAPRNVLLSYGAWKKRFGGSKDILGRRVSLSGITHTVIGVLPETFQFAPVGRPEFVTPINSGGRCEQRRSCHNLWGVARLKDGVSVDAALANMTSIAKQLAQQYPSSNRGQGASVLPLSEIIVGEIRPILLLLLAGALLLLFIAFVNVASLLLVRAETRRREVAIRGALGASVSRMFSQFAAESSLLVAAGTALGLLGANWLIPALLKLIPENMLNDLPFLIDLGLSVRTLLFAVSVAMAGVALFSVTPAAHLSLSKMRDGLTEGSRGSAGMTWHRLGAKLVVLEFATAMILLAGAGILAKSLYHLLHVELGFQADRLGTLDVIAHGPTFQKAESQLALAREVVERLERIPGVESAALTNLLPVTYNGNTQWIRFVGRPYSGEHIEVNARTSTPGYFRTIGATLLRGRHFRDDEDSSKPLVVMVNEKLAKQYFPGQDPIGKQIGDPALTPTSIRQIIGVVKDIRDGALDSEIFPTVYFPYYQDSDNSFSVVVRTAQDPGPLLPTLSAEVKKIHSELATMDEATMPDRIDRSPTAYIHRSATWLVGAFAAAALLLGVIGLYGVVAYSVSRRTREIGVRMALGAQPSSVKRLIFQEAVKLVLIAATLGFAGSVATAALMRRFFFRVNSWDVQTLAIVATALTCAALIASYLPAARAASVNPVEALRVE